MTKSVYFFGHPTTGGSNTSIGQATLRGNTTGGSNTAIGHESLRFNISGDNNTALGRNGLFDLSSGSNNTAVGENTGRGITTGSNNTILGAGVTGLSATLANNIIIADGSGNRRINVDSSGNVGINENAPTARLQIKGSGTTSATLSLKINNSANTELLKLTDEGYLGMKVVTPLAPLHVFYPGTTPNTKTIAIFDGYQSPAQPTLQIQVGTITNGLGAFFGFDTALVSNVRVGAFLKTVNATTRALTWNDDSNVGIGGNVTSNNSLTIYPKNFNSNELNTTGAMLRVATGSIRCIPQTATPDMSIVGLGAITVNSLVIAKTYTNASNLYIESPPIAGDKTTITNRWSIFVNSGNSYLNGSLVLGTTNLDNSAKLEVDSTTQGFLPPRMTTAQKNAIVTPSSGLMVYDTDLNKLCVYTTAWETITSI